MFAQPLSPLRSLLWPYFDEVSMAVRLAGGIPGQPDPDTPGEPVLPDQPTEPGEPTVPDQAPPIPTAQSVRH